MSDDTMLPVTDFAHIVSNVQHYLDAAGVKIPRGLCGASLATGLLEGGPPVCPVCAQVAGWSACPWCGGYDFTELADQYGPAWKCRGCGEVSVDGHVTWRERVAFAVEDARNYLVDRVRGDAR